MDVDSILEDDLDIEILDEVIPKKELDDESMSISSLSTVKHVIAKNPVEQQLEKQLNHVVNLIEQSKSNIEVVENVTEKIIKNLETQAAYREDVSSESDSDLYTSSGEPVLKKKRNKLFERKKVLSVEEVWQRIVDDRWVIGVVINSTTTCTLKEPTIYVCPKGKDDCHGISAFWTLVEEKFWDPTEVIGSEEQVVATAVLDLPNFDVQSEFKAHGTIFCEFDDKLFQTKIPMISLSVHDITSDDYVVNFDDEDKKIASFNILTMKAIAVDRVVLLPLQSHTGTDLIKFLETYAFKDVCGICMVSNKGSLRNCLIEVLPAVDDQPMIRLFISARSEAQLSTVVQLMREKFPELLDVEKDQNLDEAALVLLQELQLYLNTGDATELQRARIKTDLLIP